MKAIGRIFILTILVVLSSQLSAQPLMSDPVPVNPDIRIGKLDNGMTYYIKKNLEPEQRASFFIIQNVGALLENDKQNGLAHFLEHMAFNGSEHFPENEIISSLEKHGVAFGYNINAYTSFNETVYNLSDVPVDHEGLIDTCLLILNDWSNFLSLNEEDIDNERGVIAEEWRTRRTAAFRMQWQFLPVLLKGSKFAERDIIGDLDIIKGFKYKTLRNFYHDWYRTDLQAIAVVGDIDPDEIEKKVIKLFSAIPAVKKPEPRPFFEIPEHNETYYVHVTDKEASQNSVDLYIKNTAFNAVNKDHSYLKEQYIRTLFNSMMSTRINELLQKGIPPFVMGSVSYSSFLRGYDVFVIGATSKKGEDDLAFKAIYTEAERVKRHGFTDGELERAKAEMLSDWENYYKDREKIDNDTWSGNIQSHYLINEPLPSIEYEYEYLQNTLPEIRLSEVSAKAREWMTDKNRVIVVQGPEEEDADFLTEEEAKTIMEEVENSDIEPYEDSVTGESLITDLPSPGKITSERKLEGFGAVEWTLENGARVVYRKANYEKDNVTLNAFSFGGISQVSDELIPEASMLPGVVSSYGAGEFDNVALQKLLSGKKASLNVSLTEVTDNLGGSSTPADFETMMQLLHLKFNRPRFDKDAHDALMSRYEAFLLSMNNNPQKIMQDSLSLILSAYHPRTRNMDNEFLKDIEFDAMKNVYEERFRDADDFTFFIVGNIEADVVRKMSEKYIGSLNSYPEKENWIDRGVRHPEGKIAKIIEIPLTVPKATVIISFSEDMEFKPYNRQAARVLKGILDIVYNKKIREEEGGTYGVSASLSLQQFPVEKSSAMIAFDCDPERATHLKKIVFDEIERLATEGPTQENLDKAVSNVLKNREESKQHNSYWASVLYTWYLSGIDYSNPANYEDILKGFTVEDIQKSAASFFNDADVVDIVFLPRE